MAKQLLASYTRNCLSASAFLVPCLPATSYYLRDQHELVLEWLLPHTGSMEKSKKSKARSQWLQMHCQQYGGMTTKEPSSILYVMCSPGISVVLYSLPLQVLQTCPSTYLAIKALTMHGIISQKSYTIISETYIPRENMLALTEKKSYP